MRRTLAALIAGALLAMVSVGILALTISRQSNERAADVRARQALQNTYETELDSVLGAFVAAYQSTGDAAAERQAATEAEERLLTLRVPTAYKDLHLKLVIALAKLAASEDDDDVAAARALYEGALATEGWLSVFRLQ